MCTVRQTYSWYTLFSLEKSCKEFCNIFIFSRNFQFATVEFLGQHRGCLCCLWLLFFWGGVNLLSFLRRNFAIFILLRMFIRYFFHLLYHYFHGRFISFPLLVSTIRSLACPCYYSLLLQLSSLIFADYSPHFSLLFFFVYSCFFPYAFIQPVNLTSGYLP